MLGIQKRAISLLALLCFSKNLNLPTVKAMSNLTGILSVAYVTVPNDEVGKNLAYGIVKLNLAACVNIIPKVTSVYKWKGVINEDSESILMIKTRTDTINALTEYVRKNHPYELCEVISLPIQNGNEPYLKWISDVVLSMEKKNY